MAAALKLVKDGGIDVGSVPATAPRKDLAVRSAGGHVVVHLLDGAAESFSNRLRLREVLNQLATKYKLSRPTDYGIYQCMRGGGGERLLSCGDGLEMTLGQLCQDWISQAARYCPGPPGAFKRPQRFP
jgi:hypothetical protein